MLSTGNGNSATKNVCSENLSPKTIDGCSPTGIELVLKNQNAGIHRLRFNLYKAARILKLFDTFEIFIVFVEVLKFNRGGRSLRAIICQQVICKTRSKLLWKKKVRPRRLNSRYHLFEVGKFVYFGNSIGAALMVDNAVKPQTGKVCVN